MLGSEQAKRYRALAAGARRTGWHEVGATLEAASEENAVQYDILADCMDARARRRLH